MNAPAAAAMSTPKKPRRTAERILEVTLALFNRFGEPNVSTTLISAELRISPGNLYYHFPAKDELVNALVDRHVQAFAELLPAAAGVAQVEDAWFFLHLLFERTWDCRFLYRDLNDLLSKNRHVEGRVRSLLADKGRALLHLVQGLRTGGVLAASDDEVQPLATAMLVLATYWLSYEYVRDPRRALEPGQEADALGRGAWHVLGLLLPYLEPASRAHLRGLAQAYR